VGMPLFAGDALRTGVEILMTNARIAGHRLRGGSFAADMDMRFAKIAYETLVGREVDLLVAKENNTMRNDRVMHFLHLAVGKRPRQIDVADFGADMRRTGRDGNGVVIADLIAIFVMNLAHRIAVWCALRMGADRT